MNFYYCKLTPFIPRKCELENEKRNFSKNQVGVENVMFRVSSED